MTLILMLILGFVISFSMAGGALASAWMIQCTDAQRIILFEDGSTQVDTRLVITPRSSDAHAEPIVLAKGAFMSTEIERVPLRSEEKGCEGVNGGMSIISTQAESAVQFRFERLDGGSFPAGLRGLSGENRVLDAMLICLTLHSIQAPCPSN